MHEIKCKEKVKSYRNQKMGGSAEDGYSTYNKLVVSG
jgi:hypothetical protein